MQRSFAVNLLDAGREQHRAAPSASRSGRTRCAAGETRGQPRELWKWVVLAALGLLLLEWYVYNRRVYHLTLSRSRCSAFRSERQTASDAEIHDTDASAASLWSAPSWNRSEPQRRPFLDYRRFVQNHYDGLPGALTAVDRLGHRPRSSGGPADPARRLRRPRLQAHPRRRLRQRPVFALPAPRRRRRRPHHRLRPVAADAQAGPRSAEERPRQPCRRRPDPAALRRRQLRRARVRLGAGTPARPAAGACANWRGCCSRAASCCCWSRKTR